MERNHLTLGLSVVAALAAGAAGGYFFARKQLELKYEQIAEREISEAKEFYRRLNKKDGFETPEKAAETLGLTDDEPERHLRLVKAADAIRQYQGLGPTTGELVGSSRVSDDVQGVLVNVFQRIEDADADIVEPIGEQDVPFIIKQSTFMEADQNYAQVTVTWYQGDRVLADSRDEAIEDVDEAVGLNNLERFGQKSGQHNVVYVRNDALGIDYEILRSDGSFGKEVHGIGT